MCCGSGLLGAAPDGLERGDHDMSSHSTKQCLPRLNGSCPPLDHCACCSVPPDVRSVPRGKSQPGRLDPLHLAADTCYEPPESSSATTYHREHVQERFSRDHNCLMPARPPTKRARLMRLDH